MFNMNRGCEEMIGLSDMGLGISLSAFLVCLTNLIFTLISKRTGKTHNKIFIFLLCILMINAVCGMVSTFTNNSKYSSDNAYIVLQVSRYVYFLTHSLIASLFFGYMSSVVGRDLRGNSGGGFANFVRDRKMIRRMGRFSPMPMASVATTTSVSPLMYRFTSSLRTS